MLGRKGRTLAARNEDSQVTRFSVWQPDQQAGRQGSCSRLSLSPENVGSPSGPGEQPGAQLCPPVSLHGPADLKPSPAVLDNLPGQERPVTHSLGSRAS